MNQILDENCIMEERFVAFIDILGFTETVKRIELNNSNENIDLKRIKSVLNFMNEETFDPNYYTDLPIYVETEDGIIEKELGDPRLTYVSDCMIISTEPTLDGFKALSRKIHKLTADLAYDGVFCRGAITKGKLFHHDRVIFGSSYIKAYKLEENNAIYPRVIVDPDIIDFFELKKDQVPLGSAFFGKDKDGMFYQRYWTWYFFPPHVYSYNDYLRTVRDWIIKYISMFEKNEHVQSKYFWLRDELNSFIDMWSKFKGFNVEKIAIKK